MMTNSKSRKLQKQLADTGLVILGHFGPTVDDDLPKIGPMPVRTVILIGNAGSAVWPIFSRDRPDDPDPLNQWTRQTLEPIAKQFKGRALYPFDGPPYWPFQQWSRRSGNAWPSPISILMHREHGLWHAYRAAFLFGEVWEFETQHQNPTVASPCESCIEQPCLSSCPVNAFSPAGYDVDACREFLEAKAGGDCLGNGCLARRSCPVVPENIYDPEHAAFHMAAFMRASFDD